MNNHNNHSQTVRKPDYIIKLYESLLDELRFKHDLSIRAVNILSENGLTNLGAILSYWYKKDNFLSLKKLGQKTDKELINMCQLYVFDKVIDDYFTENKAPIKPHLSLRAFSDSKKEAVNQFIKKEAKGLKASVLKALSLKLNVPIEFDSVWNFFFLNKTNGYDASKFSDYIQYKISHFIKLIEDYALEIVSIEEEGFDITMFVRKLGTQSGISDSLLVSYLPQIKNRQFPIFTFINQLFSDERIFDVKDLAILKHRLRYFQDAEYLTLEEIGLQYQLTRERIRQIEDRLISKRWANNMAFLYALKSELKLYSNNPMGTTQDYLYISDDFVHAINQSENCSFTSQLIAKVLEQIYFDSHLLWVARPQYTKGYYLIDKDLATAFDFSMFIQDIQKRIKKGIMEDVTLNLDDYLSGFLKEKETHLLRRVQPICALIIEEEIPKWVSLDSDGQLIFQRNKRVLLNEYIIPLLEERHEPMYLQEMFDILSQRHPAQFVTATNLLSLLVKQSDIFTCYGEKSMYGLQKWANESLDIKAGSMHKIAEDYLALHDKPVSVAEVVEYVFKYRPYSNKKSIYSNIVAAKHKFILLERGKIGLVAKRY